MRKFEPQGNKFGKKATSLTLTAAVQCQRQETCLSSCFSKNEKGWRAVFKELNSYYYLRDILRKRSIGNLIIGLCANFGFVCILLY